MLQGPTGPHTHERARVLRDEAALISRAMLRLAEILARSQIAEIVARIQRESGTHE